MEVLAGLVVFTVGLGLFVFPRGVAAAGSDRLGRDAGHWAEVAVRAVSVLGMVGGSALLLV